MRTVVRMQEIEHRPDRNNSRWIDRRVALIIVVLDMGKIGCPGDTGMLIKLAGEAPEIGVIHDPPEIAFKVPGVDRVEAYQCREEPPIRLGQSVATKIPVGRE